MAYQRKNAPRLAMATCRTVGLPYEVSGGKSELWLSPTGFGWTGYMTCDGPWCLICSRKRIVERTNKITAGLNMINAENGPSKAYFVTLTIPRSSNLLKQINDLKLGWKNIQNSLDYKRRKVKGGEYWTVRALDVTFKPNTRAVYHVHLHCIIMTNFIAGKNEMNDIISKSWLKSNPNALRQCQHVEEVKSQGLARYCSKMAGLGMELSNGFSKQARGKGLSFSQLIQAGMLRNEYAKTNIDPIYVEFLQIMKGRRSLTFSRNWKWEKEEQEESETRPDELALVVPYTWRKAVMKRLDIIGRYAWQDKTMGEGHYLQDLVNLIEDTPDDELVNLDMHGELIGWIDNMAAQVYDQVARVYESDLRR